MIAIMIRIPRGATSTAVPVLTRKTVFLPCPWPSARIWWESSLVRSTAMKVFPESVFRQTIVLCSRAASRSSTCHREKPKDKRKKHFEEEAAKDGIINY